ncbi:MAG TPA: hypothetical protein VD789_08095 [Thermomicrobiales bacterium]|nr:hypothetical protein [Thermomicrobiales bacterium]
MTEAGTRVHHPEYADNGAEPVEPVRTIIALFDDTIDAEHALSALRRSEQPSAQISVILRERVNEPHTRSNRETLLSRVIAASALETVGGWLQGLASLILPEDRASYLVAGPIGVMLASIREAHDGDENDDADGHFKVTNRQLTRALTLFGFDLDEATYVEHRVVAGSPLIAVTSEQAPVLRAAHEIFSSNTAVHIGLTHTESSIQSIAARLLMTGPMGGGPVVITDAVAPLRSLNEPEYYAHFDRSLRDRTVVSKLGRPVGKVVDVLYETQVWEDTETDTELRRTIPRYVVVQTGKFPFGRRLTAVPAELVDSDQDPVLLRITLSELRGAPRYDTSQPLSRQDEMALRRYFHVRNYWMLSARRPNGEPDAGLGD